MSEILFKRILNSKSSIHRVEENTEEIGAGGGGGANHELVPLSLVDNTVMTNG